MKCLTCLFPALFAAAALAGEVRLYRTTPGAAFRERECTFPSRQTGPGANVIDLDAAVPRHEFLGLGVSFPEASAYLWSRLDEPRRREVMELLWTGKGAGLSIGRIHVAASDYSMHLYSYDDTPGDNALEHFSIDADRAYTLPAVRAAQAVNPDIFFFASPWSPPGWMKSNGTMCGSRLLKEHYPAYARYLARFVAAYRRERVCVSALTVQNEPETEQAFNSPTCRWTADEALEFTVRHLKPALANAGLDTAIWAYDHNFDAKGVAYVSRQLSDPDFRKAVSAVAWHPYEGSPTNLAPVRAHWPDLPMYVTEMGPHVDRSRRDILWWADIVFDSFNAGCGAFVSWCFLLDEEGQPNITPGFGCGGLLELDTRTGEIVESDQFKLFRHIGPFVRRGARILHAPATVGEGSWGLDGVKHVAFRNPDGTCTVVIACRADRFDRRQLQIKAAGMYYIIQIPGGSVTTVSGFKN
jgi:glucosylceramidase